MKEHLNRFGEFMVKNMRDSTIKQVKLILEGKVKAKRVAEISKFINQLDEEKKKMVLLLLVDTIDVALHDLLCAFQEAHDRNKGIEILFEGENVAEESGGLNEELFGDEGWIKQYSEFPFNG